MINQIQSDERFKRTGLRTYGLRQWDADEYTGVADEIAQEIEAQGGSATLEHLIEHVSNTYGVSPSSVRAYAMGPRFSRTTDGHIQLQSGARSQVFRKPATQTRGVVIIDGSPAIRIRITEAILGGSGQIVPESFALALGLEPFEDLLLDCGGHAVRFTWPTLNPSMGSVRLLLEALDATDGDTALLVPRVEAGEARLIRRDISVGLAGLPRLLYELTGIDSASEEFAKEAIGRALGLSDPSMSSVRTRLLGRGEDELAQLVMESADTGPLMLSTSTAKFVEVRWKA
jgi:hypothetical protein